MGKKTAIIIGSTGLVGGELLQVLLNSDYYHSVISISRKPVNLINDKLVQYVIDFEKLKEYKELINGNDVYCCLGTTMKSAGSKEKFYKVDYTYVVEIGQIVASNKAEKFILVSAMGANKSSSIYYNKVKGEVEEAVSNLKIETKIIVRPSLLLGDRAENRPGETAAKKITKTLSFAMAGPLKKYKPVHARSVANAMFEFAKQDLKGVHIFTSEKLHVELTIDNG